MAERAAPVLDIDQGPSFLDVTNAIDSQPSAAGAVAAAAAPTVSATLADDEPVGCSESDDHQAAGDTVGGECRAAPLAAHAIRHR